MFFFIGGVQPKTKVLDETPRLCPACGLAQARLKRIDHYLSLFFIPLFPVKKGSPLVVCDRCGHMAAPEEGLGPPPAEPPRPFSTAPRCDRCGRELEASFAYCPYCGSKV
ncbi:zinc-ribbon family protein [Desulfacinum hydrothermale DSM 13146]|uniref:Zinc-ribbon family protein n=1 Tax=Desulfacinum hydrothermale DSM 13146 TaxID=1121390 RepID=A0A1W1XAX5_9BACT|nr:zinc ribbon domain-containing protein [Desulfacinum hydrothermale]SMC21072.1 zinc-ribbon family protein [Desulfacinum hydrothermale DSM 13146]